MDFREYQVAAMRTAARILDAYPTELQFLGKDWNGEQALSVVDKLIWSLGLAGEAGEVCDYLKKVYGHGKPFDRDVLQKELGDCLWYLTVLAASHGLTLEGVAAENIRKLLTRYPKGFSVEAAAAKADEKPATVVSPGGSGDPIDTFGGSDF